MIYRIAHLWSVLQVGCFATCILGAAQANAQSYTRIVPWTNPTYSYTVESDIVYGQGEIGFGSGGGVLLDLELDLYIPDIPPPATGSNKMPLMLMLHGGSFTTGSKTQAAVVASAQAYAERGWLVAAINYRLQVDDPVPSRRVRALWVALGGTSATLRDRTRVAAIDDTLTALDFLQARNDVVENWTTVWGSSAGGNTALATAYGLDDYGISRPRIAMVVELAGRFDGIGVDNPFDNPIPIIGDPFLSTSVDPFDPLFPFTQETEAWAIEAGLLHDFQISAWAGHAPDMFNFYAGTGVTLYQRTVDWHHETLWIGLDQGPQPPPGC